ncbi:hypothetical protein EMIHUDRAFT_42339, partial [Emiliania huxleyi CCMP1516]|uniref:CS domain-containing protein n=2 Tax=Emiliania huxleyi TaxID=2903 RepID=A0A0D3KMF5_EMIH1
MLTPRFDLSQDEEFVHVRLRVPHIRMDDGEFYIDGHEFKFHLKPYFLRLTFRARLCEDGREHASYDAVAGVLAVRLPKETPGQHFEDLHMLSELLRRPQPPAGRGGGAGGPGASRGAPLIEEGDEGGGESEGDEEAWAEMLAHDAEAEQALPTDDPELRPSTAYGFNGRHAGLFRGLEAEAVLELPDPESASAAERRAARLEAEEEAFDPDHYIADFMEHRLAPESAGGEGGAVWDEEEREALVSLPSVELLIDREGSLRALCGLADLLYGYCYDVRATEGEPTCESGWTVRMLSTQLSWLDPPASPAEAAGASVRRSLCYPLLRHWLLSLRALDDVCCLLRLGKASATPPAVATIRALLAARKLLQGGAEYGYLLNRAWLDDTVIWLQRVPARRLVRLAAALEAAAPSKPTVGWPLEQYEALA